MPFPLRRVSDGGAGQGQQAIGQQRLAEVPRVLVLGHVPSVGPPSIRGDPEPEAPAPAASRGTGDQDGAHQPKSYADVLGCFPSTDHGTASVATKAMPAKTTMNTRLTKVIMAMDR